ncbi:MAG TPA: glyoxalase superfamily protein [Mycobacterium sp.]|jgi:catechol 2,3-dioxygenase-like lactoylglutathione lyase family enzyme|nr:glyoxalase superfamily protein [Mycobacterium sp.]
MTDAAFRIGPPEPILRVYDDTRALDFYCGYLGFQQDWEHRFDPHSPAYIQVSRSDAVLHLSEHYGDGSPNTALFIPINDVEVLPRALTEQRHGLIRDPASSATGPAGRRSAGYRPVRQRAAVLSGERLTRRKR